MYNQKAGQKMIKNFVKRLAIIFFKVFFPCFQNALQMFEELRKYYFWLLGSQIKYLSEGAIEKKIDFLQSWQTIGKISHLFKLHCQKILRKIQKLFRKIQNQIENNRNRVFLLTPATATLRFVYISSCKK